MKIVYLLSICLLFSQSVIGSDEHLEERPGNELQQLVQDEKYVLILFMKEPSCTGRCIKVEKQLLSVREELAEAVGAWVVKCHAPEVLSMWGGKLLENDNTETIVFVRQGKPMFYFMNENTDPDEALNYLLMNKESSVKKLTDATFEHDTQASSGATTGDWLVFFIKPECQDCDELVAHIETTAAAVKGRKNVAIIDRENESGVTTRRFGITSFPSAILFRLGKLYRYPFPKMTSSSLTAFALDTFRNAQAESIPKPKTPFDDVTQAIADWLRENPYQFLGGVVGCLLVIGLLYLLNSPPPSSWTKQAKKKKKH